MNKPLGILTALLVVALASWVGWHYTHRDNNKSLVLHGNVDARQISLSFEASGRVLEVRAEEGIRVKAGSVLALMDTTSLALQAAEAKAKIEVQRQAWLQLRNGARPLEVAQARSRVSAAQAEIRRARQELARLEAIAASTAGRGVSVQELERAKSAVQAAQAFGDERGQASRLIEVGARPEEVAGAAAQIKVSQAQLALIEHQIAQGSLKAPVDGVVRSRLLEPGDMATPQRAVFALALTQPKWVRAYVSETDLGRIRPGMAAQVVTDSEPDRPVAGSIGYISSVAEFTPKSVQTEELRTSLVYEVRIIVADADDRLRLGQPATVSLVSSIQR